MESKKIMLVGYGSAGQYVLDFISRMPELQDCEIIVASRKSEEDASARLNTTIVSAGLMGFYPVIRYVQCDLNDIDATADMLAVENPDIIGYTGRFISGIKYGAYSYPNQLGYGVWLPLAAPLIYKLCLALEKAHCEAKVINTSFPDGVCPLLYGAGHTNVITGAGNLNHLIPRMKRAISPFPSEVKLYMVGAHYLNTYVSKEGHPRGSAYYVGYTADYEAYHSTEIDLGYEDVEPYFLDSKISMESGHTRNLMIASDVSQIIRIMVTGSDELIHLPGVNGAPGGYPCTYDRDDGLFYPDLPEDISYYKAVEINKQSLACDGIEDITNGTVTFTGEAISKMKEVFDIDYPKTLKLEDMEEFAYHIKDALIQYEERKANNEN